MPNTTVIWGRVAVTGLILGAVISSAIAQERSVAVTAIVDHPALDAVRDGVLAELKANGYEIGKNLKWQGQSAQGNTGTAAQIARKYVGDNVSVIVPISTPSAQAAAIVTKTIPIVYSAVGDPVAAGLVKSWQASGTNVTGVSDSVPISWHLDVIRKVLPTAKRIGVIFNPGEANSAAFVDSLKNRMSSRGYTLVEAPALHSADVSTAAKSLVGKVDLIFAPTDNTVASAFLSVARVADEAKLPLFAADHGMVRQGAAFGVGLNYAEIGRQTGKIVVRILRGEAPGSIPPQTSAAFEFYVNADAAKAQGITIPRALRETATQVSK